MPFLSRYLFIDNVLVLSSPDMRPLQTFASFFEHRGRLLRARATIFVVVVEVVFCFLKALFNGGSSALRRRDNTFKYAKEPNFSFVFGSVSGNDVSSWRIAFSLILLTSDGLAASSSAKAAFNILACSSGHWNLGMVDRGQAGEQGLSACGGRKSVARRSC